MEALQEEYSKLKKTDPKFIGIDLDSKEYWIYGHGWKIKQLGFNSKKIVSEYFTRHDELAGRHDQLDPVKDAGERVQIVVEMTNMRDQIITECIPMMLTELGGKPFNAKKWFDDDNIPAAAWWDCARDCFLFLRGRGSREDILLSMMQSNTASQTTSGTSRKQTKST